MWFFGPPDIKELLEKQDVKSLIKALRYMKDTTVREAAVEALGNLGDIRALEPLILCLEDSDGSVRRKAAEVLGKLGDARIVEPLGKLLKSKSRDTSQAAVIAMIKLSDVRAFEKLTQTLEKSHGVFREVALEPLIQSLGDDEWAVRRKAAELLGSLGNARAVEPLGGLIRDKNKDVCRAAIFALGKFSDGLALEKIAQARRDPREMVRQAADEVLGRREDSPETSIRALRDDGLDTLSASIETPITLNCLHTVTSHVMVLVNNKNGLAQQTAAIALEKIGESRNIGDDLAAIEASQNLHLLERMIEKLKDDDRKARIAAAIVLGLLGNNRAVAPLINMLSDRKEDIRKSVAIALGRLREKSAIEPLIGYLGDQDAHFRKTAAEILDLVGEPRWKEWVKGDNWDLPRLGVAEDARAVEPLLNALKRSDYGGFGDFQLIAAQALGNKNEPRVVESLIKMLNDQGVALRVAAAGSLIQIAGCNPALLSEHWAGIVDALIHALNQELRGIRISAATLLIKIAEIQPQLLFPHWSRVAELINAEHKDLAAENSRSRGSLVVQFGSSDCTHTDRPHEDSGIGLAFPDKPPTLDF